jgi:hypothetical protein
MTKSPSASIATAGTVIPVGVLNASLTVNAVPTGCPALSKRCAMIRGRPELVKSFRNQATTKFPFEAAATTGDSSRVPEVKIGGLTRNCGPIAVPSRRKRRPRIPSFGSTSLLMLAQTTTKSPSLSLATLGARSL